jgi:flagella basal body P-ring formation protein FlgA
MEKMRMPNTDTTLSKRLLSGLLLLLTLIFVLALVAVCRADQIPTIRIKDRVEIDADPVLLGQIAIIEGGQTQFKRRLQDIVIGKAPLPGRTRRFGRDYLQARLQQYRIDLAAVRFVAPSHVVVTRSHVEITRQEIEKIVADFIVQQTSQENRTLRIKEIRVPDGVILSKGHITYNVTAPRNRQLMGRCPLAIAFSINGQAQKKLWATAIIEVLAPVVVTRKPLGRYQPITEDDIEVQTLDLANLPPNVLSNPEAAVGKRTKRAIGSQAPLVADLIELPPLVKRGDLVTIIAESESLKITTLGQVKKKGCLGERIPVVNLDSKKILHAFVIDSNTVKVDF